MFDGIRQVETLAVEACRGERTAKNLPCGSNERPARDVLGIARLLADEYDLRVFRPLDRKSVV